MPIEKFVTHTIHGLKNVNQSIEALHSGDCLRAVVKINELKLAREAPTFTQTSSNKVKGGSLK